MLFTFRFHNKVWDIPHSYFPLSAVFEWFFWLCTFSFVWPRSLWPSSVLLQFFLKMFSCLHLVFITKMFLPPSQFKFDCSCSLWEHSVMSSIASRLPTITLPNPHASLSVFGFHPFKAELLLCCHSPFFSRSLKCVNTGKWSAKFSAQEFLATVLLASQLMGTTAL